VSRGVRLSLGFLGLGLFCAKGLWFFDVFAPDLCAEAGIWSDLGERVRRENSNPMNRDASKEKMQNAKLRKPDREASSGRDGCFDWGLDRGQRGADGLQGIGFVLGLFFWVGRGGLLL